MESPRIEIETAAPEKNDLTELKSALLSELDNIHKLFERLSSFYLHHPYYSILHKLP